MSTEKKLLRGSGITEDFAKKFKESKFYTEIYCKHHDEIIVGVRKDYINLYYNCDSISKIYSNQRIIKGEISSFYLNEGPKRKKITADELCCQYEEIKKRSDNRNKFEKQAQERLYIANNKNILSNWYCFDVEYKKAFINSQFVDFGGRFDIMAISKDLPHKVALIELKYGSGAIGGTSGIRKHVEDFSQFSGEDSKGVSFFQQLKPEIVSIMHSLELLGVDDIPDSLKGIKEDDIYDIPSFYFITLNNNPTDESTNTPKKTMSGYLFNDKRWGCTKISPSVKNGDYFDLTKKTPDFHPTFLFSESHLPDIDITDIIDDESYDIETL